MSKKYYKTEKIECENEYGSEYCSEDIATALCTLAKVNITDMDFAPSYYAEKECEEALHDLMCVCENENNREAYRILYKILAKITYLQEAGVIKVS